MIVMPLGEEDNIQIVSILEKISIGEFKPEYEYGLGVEMESREDENAINFLHRTAKEVLPKGTPYELRMQDDHGGISNFGRSDIPASVTACWYYSPNYKVGEGLSIEQWRTCPEWGTYRKGMFFA